MIRRVPLIETETTIEVMVGTAVLHVDDQYGQVCVWIDETRADRSHPLIRSSYTFTKVPTGSASPSVADHVGSTKVVGQEGEEVVWHVFLQRHFIA